MSSPRIAYLTAGAAGMYCGSCLHDNALVAALHRMGVDAQLLPAYTPIRTDETDVTIDRVFFGGVNVYLEQKSALVRRLPRWLFSWLDNRRVLKWATSRGIQTDPKELGALTVSMLKGEFGNQRKEVARLVDYLTKTMRPDLVVLTNLLVAGFVPQLKKALPNLPVLVTLQGDDVFLDGLAEPYRRRAFAEIQRLTKAVDGYVTYAKCYADYMAKYLSLPREIVHLVPLGIDTRDFPSPPKPVRDFDTTRPPAPRGKPTIGYLARIDPVKGLHLLVDAFLKLRQRPKLAEARLRIAGWLGQDHQAYADEQFGKLRQAGAGNHFEYVGEVDRDEKIAFLKSLRVFSVPTTYRDPKGLYVLESLAAGVPVIQPNHGAFPELISATGGGRLFEPGETNELADALENLLTDHAARNYLSQQGQRTVHTHHNAEAMAQGTFDVYRRFLQTHEFRPEGGQS